MDRLIEMNKTYRIPTPLGYTILLQVQEIWEERLRVWDLKAQRSYVVDKDKFQNLLNEGEIYVSAEAEEKEVEPLPKIDDAWDLTEFEADLTDWDVHHHSAGYKGDRETPPEAPELYLTIKEVEIEYEDDEEFKWDWEAIKPGDKIKVDFGAATVFHDTPAPGAIYRIIGSLYKELLKVKKVKHDEKAKIVTFHVNDIIYVEEVEYDYDY